MRRADGEQRSLRATVEWSDALLSQDERAFLRRMSVFAGSFDLAAAEAVIASEGTDAVDLLSQLVDKSMVVVERRDGGTRYRLLETIRQYGQV